MYYIVTIMLFRCRIVNMIILAVSQNHGKTAEFQCMIIIFPLKIAISGYTPFSDKAIYTVYIPRDSCIQNFGRIPNLQKNQAQVHKNGAM